MHYDSFEDVMRGLAKKKRTAHLLLGNGFSMAYDSSIFSYNALFDFVASLKDPLLAGVLGAMKTKNFELMMEQLDAFSVLLDVFGGDQLLHAAMVRLQWSARAYHRVLKVARTIADLADAPRIASAHVAEAIQCRRGLQPPPI